MTTMAKWRVYATVCGGKYLGEYEAETGEEAIEKGLDKNGYVSVCHQCSRECDSPEIDFCTAENDAGEEVTNRPADDWEAKARAAGWTPPKAKRARKASRHA
jgi:hypothetical protein